MHVGRRSPARFRAGRRAWHCLRAGGRRRPRASWRPGLLVRRNDPYAGGYITRHYGRPRDGVHAFQIEMRRSLYMDEARMAKLPAFAAVQRDVTRLVAALAGLGPGLKRP